MLRVIMLFLGVTSYAWMAFASGTSTDQMAQGTDSKAAVSLYDQGVEASKTDDFQKALPLFEKALKEDPNNPDVLNMLAHTQRKLGMIDDALANYKRAIEVRSNFPEAREYLAEAYIDAALREIDTLKGYGDAGKEQVEDATQAFKDAAQKL
jgi:tetratricopeptide (TPR) repeat protein